MSSAFWRRAGILLTRASLAASDPLRNIGWVQDWPKAASGMDSMHTMKDSSIVLSPYLFRHENFLEGRVVHSPYVRRFISQKEPRVIKSSWNIVKTA